MKLVVTKEALLEGLQRTQNVVGSRPTLAVLSNVLLETVEGGLRLTTTDFDTTVECQIPALKIERAGSTTLPVRRFAAIARELCGSEVTIETDPKNDVSTIRCSNSIFKIFGLPREEFPKLPELKDASEIVVKQAELRDGLKRTSYAISMDETRYVLNGILFSFKDNKLTLVATDGRRLALYESELELPRSQEREFIVPTKTIIELQRLLNGDGEVRISVTQNIVAFHLDNILLISKLVEGNYPNYRQVIPGEAREKIKLEREMLLNIVRRVSLLSVDKSSSVKLHFSKNNMEVLAISPEIGEAKESLPISYQGVPFSIAFNPEFLLDPLRNVPDEQIDLALIDEMSPGVIRTPTGSNFLYVLMPMRVSV